MEFKALDVIGFRNLGFRVLSSAVPCMWAQRFKVLRGSQRAQCTL